MRQACYNSCIVLAAECKIQRRCEVVAMDRAKAGEWVQYLQRMGFWGSHCVLIRSKVVMTTSYSNASS
jgi:hypothetical protein